MSGFVSMEYTQSDIGCSSPASRSRLRRPHLPHFRLQLLLSRLHPRRVVPLRDLHRRVPEQDGDVGRSGCPSASDTANVSRKRCGLTADDPWLGRGEQLPETRFQLLTVVSRSLLPSQNTQTRGDRSGRPGEPSQHRAGGGSRQGSRSSACRGRCARHPGASARGGRASCIGVRMFSSSSISSWSPPRGSRAAPRPRFVQPNLLSLGHLRRGPATDRRARRGCTGFTPPSVRRLSHEIP